MKTGHAVVLDQKTASMMLLGGRGSGRQDNRQKVPLGDQTALDHAEGENMQGHLSGPAVLRQHFNGDMCRLGQKPAAEVASWDD